MFGWKRVSNNAKLSIWNLLHYQALQSSQSSDWWKWMKSTFNAIEYVRCIDHNTYIILIHQSYRITRMYKWEHEWSTSYLHFHALTHTERTLRIWTASMSYDHVSTYPKADIDNNWSFARKFQAFNDFHCCQDHWVLQKCQLCWSKHRWGLSVLSCPKILPKTVKQPFGP